MSAVDFEIFDRFLKGRDFTSPAGELLMGLGSQKRAAVASLRKVLEPLILPNAEMIGIEGGQELDMFALRFLVARKWKAKDSEEQAKRAIEFLVDPKYACACEKYRTGPETSRFPLPELFYFYEGELSG